MLDILDSSVCFGGLWKEERRRYIGIVLENEGMLVDARNGIIGDKDQDIKMLCCEIKSLVKSQRLINKTRDKSGFVFEMIQS